MGVPSAPTKSHSVVFSAQSSREWPAIWPRLCLPCPIMPQVPLKITFRDMDHSDAIEEHVRRRAAKLETFYDRITGCRVALEMPVRRHRHGKRYQVRIDLAVPGDELVVTRNPPQNLQHEDLHATVEEAFDDAERLLEDHVRRQRGEVKQHESVPRGVVTKLFRESGYGFLESTDGVDIYFHRNSVLGSHFDDLEIGSEVRYSEEMGEKGPQASTVAMLRKGRH